MAVLVRAVHMHQHGRILEQQPCIDRLEMGWTRLTWATVYLPACRVGLTSRSDPIGPFTCGASLGLGCKAAIEGGGNNTRRWAARRRIRRSGWAGGPGSDKGVRPSLVRDQQTG
jgi:hypothetical protein